MKDIDLFQLGSGLATGAQEEDTARGTSAPISPLDSEGIISPLDSEGIISPLDSEREDHFIRKDGKVYAGTHLIIEVQNGTGLDDEDRIQTAFREMVDVSGATLLHIHTHKFSPQGVSGVAVLAESHISVHTWPEIGYGAFDVFMCGDAQPWKAVEVLKQRFATTEVHVKELLRGEGLVEAPYVAA